MPVGYSPDALNWITGEDKDNIQLRRGSKLLGQTRVDGKGKVMGLGVGIRRGGGEIPFFSYGRKIKYYDSVTDDTIEIGSNTLPAFAEGDHIAITPYQNLAGAFVYISSPNSSIYKVAVANPGTAIDQSMTNYRGVIQAGQGRIFLWNRKNSTNRFDALNAYLSWIDKDDIVDYPTVTGESVGASGSKTYNHTLAQATGKQTVFAITVQATVAAGTETFQDDGDGVLTSNFGGTGTINYATGALSVTFSNTTTGAVTADYFYEDATNSDSGVANSGAPLDFSFSASRVAGEGNIYAQNGGGNLKAMFPLSDTFYFFHTKKTWAVRLTNDDTAATNLPFREQMGVPSFRSVHGADDGVYFLDNADPNYPAVKRLSIKVRANSVDVVTPDLLSAILDLSIYNFDEAVVFKWGNYVILSCAEMRLGASKGYNSRFFVYNLKSKAWDLMDYPSNALASYNGTLISGDSISNNLFVLFSGFDDDEATIPNHWISSELNLDLPGQKRFHRFAVDGLIQTNQSCKVSFSFDGGTFSLFQTISGDGSYVAKGTSTSIGLNTLGSKEVGGGAGIEYANPFLIDFPVHSPRFQYVQVKLECAGIGYFQVNYFEFKDIRFKGKKTLSSNVV
jgi:hypothetical protein